MNEEYKPINNLWKDSEGYRYFGTLKLSSKIKYNGGDFIPLWEWVKQLQQERNQFKEYTNHNYDKAKKLQQENKKLNGAIQTYDILLKSNVEENKRLKDNWNKLKEHCNVMLSIFEKMNNKDREKQLDKYVIYDKFLSKMQELEGSDSK